MRETLRLEFCGALFHVTSRGVRREAICQDDLAHAQPRPPAPPLTGRVGREIGDAAMAAADATGNGSCQQIAKLKGWRATGVRDRLADSDGAKAETLKDEIPDPAGSSRQPRPGPEAGFSTASLAVTLPPMRTRKLFWQDPYCAQANCAVSGVSGADVFLASTIFFAFSGGQESDRGTIGGFEVLEARREGLDIRYTLEQGHSIRQGEVVMVAIDWDRRYRLMRLHFAAELILELLCRRLPQAPRIGAHISQDKARIDFALSSSIAPLLPSVADEANAIVSADLPIVTGFDDEESERRYWFVEGLSRVPCGGTHVRRTGELGRVSLKRKNVGSGKERVEIRVTENMVPSG